MRRLWLPLLLVCLSCSRGRTRLGQTDEESPRMATVLHVADERASTQLLNGFYNLELNSWRWTAGHFSVLLQPPRSAARDGAVLKLNLHVPDPVIAKLHSVTLTGSIDSTTFRSETYPKPGDYVYSRDVPANLLPGPPVKVDFALDRALPPDSVDTRELGIIVSSIGFESVK